MLLKQPRSRKRTSRPGAALHAFRCRYASETWGPFLRSERGLCRLRGRRFTAIVCSLTASRPSVCGVQMAIRVPAQTERARQSHSCRSRAMPVKSSVQPLVHAAQKIHSRQSDWYDTPIQQATALGWQMERVSRSARLWCSSG